MIMAVRSTENSIPQLPNHKLFDSENKAQKEDYYFSDTLLHLDRLQNEDSLAHHAKLNKTLETQSKIKKINATRQTGEEQEMVNRG